MYKINNKGPCSYFFALATSGVVLYSTKVLARYNEVDCGNCALIVHTILRQSFLKAGTGCCSRTLVVRQ